MVRLIRIIQIWICLLLWPCNSYDCQGNHFSISSELWAPVTSSTELGNEDPFTTVFRRWKSESFRGNREDVQCAYLEMLYICFCGSFQNTRHHPIVKWFVHFEGNQHVQFFTVQLDAQQNFTDRGSPAPQDLSTALFMAVTWRCNMPSQGHEPKEKLTTPSKNHLVRILLQVTQLQPPWAPIFFYRVWWPVTFHVALQCFWSPFGSNSWDRIHPHDS